MDHEIEAEHGFLQSGIRTALIAVTTMAGHHSGGERPAH
jgi:hypothetical protein